MRYPPSVASTFITTVAVNGHATLNDARAAPRAITRGVSAGASSGTVVVGALTEDSAAQQINGNQNDDSAQSAGAVYVFPRSASTWAQQAYIKTSHMEAGDDFGFSVALSAAG